MPARANTRYRSPISGAINRYQPPKPPKPKKPKPGGGGGGGGNNNGGGGGNNNNGGDNGGWNDSSPDSVGDVAKGRDGTINLPALDPLDALQNSAAHVSLYSGFRDQMAMLRQQQEIARGRLDLTKQQLRQQRFSELQTVAGQSNERGTLGSSMDFTERAAVRDEFDAQAAEARNAFAEGKLANLGQRMQARRDYETGVLNLIAMKNAMKSLESVDDVLQDSDGGGQGGGGGKKGGGKKGGNKPGGKKGGGKGEATPKTYAQLAKELKQIQNRGYSGQQFLKEHDKFRKKYKSTRKAQ